jgi:hypothetical protein
VKVSKVIQINDSTAIQFEGELSPEESDIVVGYGLNYLIRMGAFPGLAAAITTAAKELEEASEDALPIASVFDGNGTIN